MKSGRRQLRGYTILTASALVILAACGGNGSGSALPVPECSETATIDDLSAGAVCADSGFRLKTNDFSFPNWGGFDGSTDEMGVDTLVRLYGAKAVCISGTTSEDCMLNPSAASVLEEWQSAIAGGRCEGMATLAMRYFLQLDSPSDVEEGASNAVALKRPNLNVDQEINTWWATQFMPEVRKAAAESRDKNPTELVYELIDGLKNKLGFTIGIYGDGFGHAVTPFAVTRVGTTYSVHIYDNNYPGKPAIITVDSSTNKWSYEGAAVNLEGTPTTWTGGKGTFELTPMAVRNGPFTDEFGASEVESKGTTTISMAVSAQSGEPAAGLLITTSSGKKVGVVNGEQVQEIPGAIYTIAKAQFGVSRVMIDLPAITEDYSIHVVSATAVASDAERDVIIGVQTPNGLRTSITSKRPLVQNPTTTITSAELVVRPMKGVTFSAQRDSIVTIAGNRDKVSLNLRKNGKVKAENTTVTGVDSTGKKLQTTVLTKPALRQTLTSVATSTTQTSAPLRTTSTTVARSTTSTTVARSTTSTTVARSTTTTVARSTTSTTVPRTTTTTVARTTTTIGRQATSVP